MASLGSPASPSAVALPPLPPSKPQDGLALDTVESLSLSVQSSQHTPNDQVTLAESSAMDEKPAPEPELAVLQGDGMAASTAQLCGSDTQLEGAVANEAEAAAAANGAVMDRLPPSQSVMQHLDDVLKDQFGASDNMETTLDQPPAEKANDQAACATKDAPAQSQSTRISNTFVMQQMDEGQNRVNSGVKSELEQSKVTGCARLADNKYFTLVFMTLTFYALFAPDLDLMFGNKTSLENVQIATTVVCSLFLFEILVLSFGRAKYVGKAYFWLDIVALLSLLPDTMLRKALFGENDFVAGRSSKLTRLIRVASKGSKATRLNRLTRLVRVASLMPKISAFLGRRPKKDDTEKVLQKKLRRVFMFLDEDMDGFIPKSAVMSCLQKMKESDKDAAGGKKLWGVVQMAQAAKRRRNNASSRNQGPESSPSRRSNASEEDESPPGHRTMSQVSRDEDRKADSVTRSSSLAGRAGAVGRKMSGLLSRVPGRPSRGSAEEGDKKRSSTWKGTRADDQRKSTEVEEPQEDEGALVDFSEFRRLMLEDAGVSARLRHACQLQLRQGGNTQTMRGRHSEYVAVKVALGVLLLLFATSLLEPEVADTSVLRGLEHLTDLLHRKYPSAANDLADSSIPDLVEDQVTLWHEGVGYNAVAREVLYLDVNSFVYCNAMTSKPCIGDIRHHWVVRRDLLEIRDFIVQSEHRFGSGVDDVMAIMLLDPPNWEPSEECRGGDIWVWNSQSPEQKRQCQDEKNAHTMSVAVLNIREKNLSNGLSNTGATLLVIVIILLGIVLLTKDLTFLSRNLLKPLRELAEDMESIAQLQLAGVSNPDDVHISDGTSEVRLIRRTFENMKKAIKSWGKYVPWPVVQLLLRANVEANLEVNELEVTVFFSDIASFTTIVEGIPPESSLLLLSRYFNDMSKIIDDHGGVVLEFIGDAILCVFGAPLNNPEHPTAAVKASLRMLSCLRRMNEWSKEKHLPEVNIRCGVHTGRVLVGNMGFHSRMKYGIVGEESHVPDKLEELNKTYGTSMLISAQTFAAMDRTCFVTRPVDYIRIVPTAGSSLIYQVVDRHKRRREQHPLWPACDLHQQAMEHYRKREFQEANQKFQKVGEIMASITGKEDGASALLAKRSDVYSRRPPPDDWDGVWIEEKQ